MWGACFSQCLQWRFFLCETRVRARVCHPSTGGFTTTLQAPTIGKKTSNTRIKIGANSRLGYIRKSIFDKYQKPNCTKTYIKTNN
uniref:Uncharacterized protein n=1 Tax=Arundo donax TaxID=35708 RepID=A0A0A9CY19_ARUDO